MIEFLKSWMLNTITLVIFLVIFEMLVPSGKIKKFINLVSGFILIIAIINPFLGLLKNKIDLKEFQVADSNMIDKKEIEENSKILKDGQMKQIAEVYRKKIISQVEEGVKDLGGFNDVKADVIINEDYNSAAFGEIKRVYVILGQNDKTNGIKPVAKIEKVEIGKGEAVEKTKKEVDKATKTKIEEKISKLFEVQKDNIVISLQD